MSSAFLINSRRFFLGQHAFLQLEKMTPQKLKDNDALEGAQVEKKVDEECHDVASEASSNGTWHRLLKRNSNFGLKEKKHLKIILAAID